MPRALVREKKKKAGVSNIAVAAWNKAYRRESSEEPPRALLLHDDEQAGLAIALGVKNSGTETVASGAVHLRPGPACAGNPRLKESEVLRVERAVRSVSAKLATQGDRIGYQGVSCSEFCGDGLLAGECILHGLDCGSPCMGECNVNRGRAYRNKSTLTRLCCHGRDCTEVS